MIAAGDKVVMWYISGNRDESVFVDADRLQVDRPNARQHIAFGMGPHRCLGARLAEMQLRILWEEVLVRDLDIEILGPPTYAFSNLVRSRSEEHTSELQSLMRISYAVFCLQKKTKSTKNKKITYY